MIGILVGFGVGCGVLLIVASCRQTDPRAKRGSGRQTWHARTAELLVQADVRGVTPVGLVVASVTLALVVVVLALGVSHTITIGLAFGLMAGYLPLVLVRRRARQRRDELRGLWPDVVDNLTSSIRAGLSLSEALAQIGEQGPPAMREPFQRFAADYQASGRFGDCLTDLKANLSDPVGDRLVEALRVARDVGGNDLGRLLRTLSSFLRDDLRTRSEMESRQSWTVNGARLAVAAPWALLALLSLRPEAVAAYDSGAGVVVLGVGAALCVVAYRVMLRVGRLPDEQRVLR